MIDDRERDVPGRRHHLEPEGGVAPARAKAIPPRRADRPEATGPPATRGGFGTVFVALLAWYLALLGLLAVLESTRRPAGEVAPAVRDGTPPAAPAEGPTRHQ